MKIRYNIAIITRVMQIIKGASLHSQYDQEVDIVYKKMIPCTSAKLQLKEWYSINVLHYDCQSYIKHYCMHELIMAQSAHPVLPYGHNHNLNVCVTEVRSL